MFFPAAGDIGYFSFSEEEKLALKVIGAGLGRTATFSLKFALEHIGFGPCYHMSEVFASARRSIPLWLDVIGGDPDWDAIFDGFQSTTDYPACSYWRELTEYYPDAKVVLTSRDADSWFDSVSETIFSPRMQTAPEGSPQHSFMHGAIFHAFNGQVGDRAFMTDWYRKRNQEIIDSLPPERLLLFHPKDGWEPLCKFLGVDLPAEPFPRVNSRDEILDASGGESGLPTSPEDAEAFGKAYIEQLRTKAFA